jgi:MFS family permease
VNAGDDRAWAAFRYRDYRLLWATLLTGGMVLWLRILGTAQWLLDETGSPIQVGFIGVVQLCVQIPALLWGGTLADRIDRKGLLVLANGTTTVLMFTLAMLDLHDLLAPWMLFLAIALTATSQMLANPSRAALSAISVPERHLMRAVSSDNATGNLAAIAGPLLFAALSVQAGITTAFFVAAGLGSAATLLPLALRLSGRVEGGREGSTLQQTLEGLRYVARHPILPGMFLLDTGITVVSFYREILPVLALGMFAAGASATGILGAANAAGAVAGALLAAVLAAYRAKGMLVLYASLAYGLILFGFAGATHLFVGALMIALLGLSDAITVTVRHSTVMLTTPDAMRGRAYAAMILAAQTANNLGTIWVGFWAGSIGAHRTILLGGVLSVLATLIIWRLWRPIRAYRSP